MKRATYTQFRDPRECTPPAQQPNITNTGDYLLSGGGNASKNCSISNQSKSKRFLDMLRILKYGRLEPGPGHYRPKNDLVDRLKSKPCIVIRKPETFDEHLFEVVNGTTKVLQPQYMNEKLRSSFYRTKAEFINSRPESVHRKGISDHYVHQKLMKCSQTFTPRKVKGQIKPSLKLPSS